VESESLGRELPFYVSMVLLLLDNIYVSVYFFTAYPFKPDVVYASFPQFLRKVYASFAY
jgi:hypothetical protein